MKIRKRLLHNIRRDSRYMENISYHIIYIQKYKFPTKKKYQYTLACILYTNIYMRQLYC